MVRVILAENYEAGRNYARNNFAGIDNLVVVRNVQTLEGLRFRYEDVVRAPGWSKNPQIEEIEDRILRTHIVSLPS